MKIDFNPNFPSNEHGHEHEHEHEMVEVEVFSIVEDDGKEKFFKELEEINNEGKVYLICQEVFLDKDLKEIIDEGDVYIFQKVQYEGEEFIEYVDDYEVAKHIFDMWIKNHKDME